MHLLDKFNHKKALKLWQLFAENAVALTNIKIFNFSNVPGAVRIPLLKTLAKCEAGSMRLRSDKHYNNFKMNSFLMRGSNNGPLHLELNCKMCHFQIVMRWTRSTRRRPHFCMLANASNNYRKPLTKNLIQLGAWQPRPMAKIRNGRRSSATSTWPWTP